ncbi:uncharacterized protein MKK02DRAFT_39459 [Dioszegia hungarica]|uniref:Uncharacterized protein n=1 Tax=Dioszegia hungarica TaxID=4972 RepID=A0AA38LYK6_9TREE|nr:uncharacterized protein MKK02DRAFT_39459 [Dioszegia hungarica]KAI9639166.1 hypothetical protein MKK02DRAFT_39459 [Dioszegia hungarica]
MSDISNDEQGWWQRLADLLESDEGRKRIVAMFTDSHEGGDRYLLDHMSGSYDAKQGQRLAELFGSDDGRQELVEMFFRSRDGGADLLTLISSRLQEKYQDAPPLTLSNAVSWPGFWDRGFGERIRRRSRDDLALSEGDDGSVTPDQDEDPQADPGSNCSKVPENAASQDTHLPSEEKTSALGTSVVQWPTKLPRITKTEFNEHVFEGSSSRLKLEGKYDLQSIKSHWRGGNDRQQVNAFSHYTEGLQDIAVNEYRGTLFGLHAYRKLRKGDEVVLLEADRATLDDLIRNAPKAAKPT